jgi:hypothetical protein
MDERPDGISRRDALRKVAFGGTVLGGAAWIAPSIITTVVAQAAGSAPPPDTVPHGTTTTPGHGTTTTPTTAPTKVQGSTVVPGSSTTDPTPEGSGVLAAQSANSATLPFTGANVGPMAAAGAGLIAGGIAVAAAAKRLPQPASAADDDTIQD